MVSSVIPISVGNEWVVVLQALKEAVEIMMAMDFIKVMEIVSVKRVSDGKEIVPQDWLRKYGFDKEKQNEI